MHYTTRFFFHPSSVNLSSTVRNISSEQTEFKICFPISLHSSFTILEEGKKSGGFERKRAIKLDPGTHEKIKNSFCRG